MAEKLPDYIKKEFYAAFKRFDKDGDETISTDEIGDVLKSLKIKYDEEKKLELIKKIDIDGSGNIDFDEFCSLIALKLKVVDSDEEFIEVFKIFDKNLDGLIDFDDIKEVFEYLDENITDKEIKELIEIADKNKDGYLDYNEFMEFIMKKDNSN